MAVEASVEAGPGAPEVMPLHVPHMLGHHDPSANARLTCVVIQQPVLLRSGAVGHGGHYHSQSPEAFYTHVPGIKVGRAARAGPAQFAKLSQV